MRISNLARLLQVALIGACTGLVHAEDVDSKRSAVIRVIEESAPELLTEDGELVADWKARLAARKRVAPVKWIPSDHGAMEGEVFDAITFRDDASRYDLILDQDGAILLNTRARLVSDSLAFNVGPVPTVKDPSRVRVASWGELARRNGNTGTFDMEVGNLTAETARDALERSDAAAAFLDSGTVAVLFFVNGEVNEVLQFAPPDQEGNGSAREPSSLEDKRRRVCLTLFSSLIQDDAAASGLWLDHCNTASVP